MSRPFRILLQETAESLSQADHVADYHLHKRQSTGKNTELRAMLRLRGILACNGRKSRLLALFDQSNSKAIA